MEFARAYWSGSSPATGGGSSSGMSGAMGNIGMTSAIAGSVMSIYGAFSSARSERSALRYQSAMARINARMAERTAQSILEQGEKEIGRLTMKAGQVKSAQRTAQAARGIVGGVGSAAEEIASLEVIKEIDVNMLNANSVRAAWSARAQVENYGAEARSAKAGASSIFPYLSAATSLVSSASTVSEAWYRNKRQAYMTSFVSEG